MRRLLVALFCFVVMLLTACDDKNSVRYLSKNEVYFFYQTTCPHCHTAAQYIKEHHPDLKVKGLDIKMPGNLRMFHQAVSDYKIETAAGTPLICMGDNYIMGWNDSDTKLFDEYVSGYYKE